MSSPRPDSLPLRDGIVLAIDDVTWNAIRAQGAGGQNVNKVASAVHLRFDIAASSLPQRYKEQLLACRDRRISEDGIVVIKAQRFRAREKNLGDALTRLQQFILRTTEEKTPRKRTRPSVASRRKRLDSKTRRGRLKALRGKRDTNDD